MTGPLTVEEALVWFDQRGWDVELTGADRKPEYGGGRLWLCNIRDYAIGTIALGSGPTAEQAVRVALLNINPLATRGLS